MINIQDLQARINAEDHEVGLAVAAINHPDTLALAQIQDAIHERLGDLIMLIARTQT